MVWPMLPRVFTEGDTVELYAAVHNRTKTPQQMDVSLKVENGTVLSPAKVRVVVPAESQIPVYWTFQPEKEGLHSASDDREMSRRLRRIPQAFARQPTRGRTSRDGERSRPQHGDDRRTKRRCAGEFADGINARPLTRRGHGRVARLPRAISARLCRTNDEPFPARNSCGANARTGQHQATRTGKRNYQASWLPASNVCSSCSARMAVGAGTAGAGHTR